MPHRGFTGTDTFTYRPPLISTKDCGSTEERLATASVTVHVENDDEGNLGDLDENGKVVAYFKEFPLEGVQGHENSKSAAQAALAANAQGKFKEMHQLLFDNQPEQDHDHVSEYAKQIGLDLTKFESDYAAFADQVEADKKEGETLDFTNDDGTKGVDETPTVFIDGKVYSGPRQVRYIEMWIDEELAVNR